MLITYVQRKAIPQAILQSEDSLGTFANFYREDYFLPVQVPILSPFGNIPSSFTDEIRVITPLVEQDIFCNLLNWTIVNPLFNLVNYEDGLPFIYIQEDDSTSTRILWSI